MATKSGETDMIDFLQAYTLKDEHFNIEQEFLIDGLIPKGLITLFYAQGGTGKSFLAISLANYLATQKGQQVVYIDFDNPIRVLKERGIDSLIANSANISYIQRSAVNMKNVDLIKEIECRAIGQSYKDCLFIIDSIRNITDIHNNNKCGDMMDMFMNIREAGATIILLSHSNKDGRNYEGSANIRNSLDCMYKVNKRPSDKHYLNLLLEVDKERAGVSDFAFSIDTKQLTLQEMDMDIAMMDAHEVEMVEQIKKVLLIRGELNKKALMEAIGKDKRDKTNKRYY